MEVRVALALCAVIGSALCGRALAGASRRRVETLANLVTSIRQLRVRMVTMFEPLGECLGQSDCPLFVTVSVAMRGGMGAREAWLAVKPRARRTGGEIDALTAADVQTLERLFAGLGESGRESQDALLKGCAQALEATLDGARAKAGEAERLYISLGLLIGLMLALIVI